MEYLKLHPQKTDVDAWAAPEDFAFDSVIKIKCAKHILLGITLMAKHLKNLRNYHCHCHCYSPGCWHWIYFHNRTWELLAANKNMQMNSYCWYSHIIELSRSRSLWKVWSSERWWSLVLTVHFIKIRMRLAMHAIIWLTGWDGHCYLFIKTTRILTHHFCCLYYG